MRNDAKFSNLRLAFSKLRVYCFPGDSFLRSKIHFWTRRHYHLGRFWHETSCRIRYAEETDVSKLSSFRKTIFKSRARFCSSGCKGVLRTNHMSQWSAGRSWKIHLKTFFFPLESGFFMLYQLPQRKVHKVTWIMRLVPFPDPVGDPAAGGFLCACDVST